MSEKQLNHRNTYNNNSCRHHNYNYYQNDKKDNNKMTSHPNNRQMPTRSGEIFMPPSKQHSGYGSNNGSNKKKSGNANHLLNVQFERAINTSSMDILPPSSGAKKRNNRMSSDFSKNQFLQANYKLIITPYQHKTDEGLKNPDALISWDLVEEVIFPVKDELVDCKCPVCLDTTIISKMSKCGHIMCFICTLQYLGSEYSKKCPICGEKINRKDLKSVQYTTMHEPQASKQFTFKLLTCQKGSLQPSLCKEETVYAHGDPPQTNTTSLCRLPSNEISENSKFSRVTTASPEYLETMTFIEQQRLLEVRTECLNSANMGDGGGDVSVLNRGDIEWLPSVTEALALVEEKMNKLSEEKLSFEKEIARGSSVMQRTPSDTESIHSCSNTQSSLPFEMDDLDALDQIDSTQCPRPRSDSAGWNASLLSLSSSSSSSPGASYFYQSADGELVFLHSISFKPLLAQAGQNVNLLPREITATVLEVEELKVTQSTRQKMSFMHHLPIQCSIMMVELDLSDLVTSEVMVPFMDDINKRAKIRKKKENKKAIEKKDEITEKIKHEIFVEDMKERWRLKCEQEKATINELLTGPTPGEVHTPVASRSSSGKDGNNVHNQNFNDHDNDNDDEVANDALQSSSTGGSWSGNSVLATTPPNWSFARIAASGYYPTLSEASEEKKSSDISTSPPLGQMTVLSSGVWGQSKNNTTVAVSTSPDSSSNSSSGSGKKSKGTPLFSNAGGRSYR